MIILHASWFEQKLHLWAEMTPETPYIPHQRRGRKPKIPRPKPFPYDAGAKELQDSLSSFGSGIIRVKRRVTTTCAWLPSSGGIPLASSPMIAEPPASIAQAELLPWLVTVLPLRWEEIGEILCRCVSGDLLARGVLAATDLRWWSESLRLAGALTVRQAYLPGVEEGERGLEARWQPVFEGANQDRLVVLARHMPASARCLTSTDTTAPPNTPPEYSTRGFISRMMDWMIRKSTMATDVSLAARKPKNNPKFDSVHDAWLHALQTDLALIPWDDRSHLIDLANQIDQWRRPIQITAQAKCRLCFRLEEPAPAKRPESISVRVSGKNWYLRYLLQPQADRSLQVPVAEVWKTGSRSARMLKKLAGEVQEYLLTALGQASELCPDIAVSLESKHPGGCILGTENAYEFLKRYAPALETVGFGLMLPAWWTQKGTKQRLSLRAKVKSPQMQSNSGLTLSTITEVNWKLALGDTTISLEDINQLAKMKVPLVQVRGTWVEVDARQIKEVAELWKQRSCSEISVGEVVRMALGVRDERYGLPVGHVEAEGWVGKLLDRLQSNELFEELVVPAQLQGTLRPYQRRGYSWLAFLRQWGLGACLADDMGLGKTAQALTLIAREREVGETRPVLVICPTSVINNWVKESQKFTPELSVLVHHGVGRRKRETFIKQVADHALVVSSYGLLHRDLEFLQAVPWASIILDEAQNIKNPETKQSQAARALSADYRIALTGTPVENHVGDLWAVMEFLNPRLLGTQNSFKQRFFIPIQRDRNQEAAEQLRRLTGPFILRRLKTDKSIIADLPEKMEIKTYCTLTREQATLYAAVLRETTRVLEETDGIQRKGVILATLSKLKQICNHPAQFLADNSVIEKRSGKVSRLVEMLEEVIDEGGGALVFSQFAKMGEILKQYLQEVFGREVLFLHGSVSRKRRDQMIERFQQKDGPPVFVLSLKAGGTGLNLTRANHVFHFDRWWNPAVENQATDRAFRIGQTRNVQVYKFICAGTLEERIDEMIESKASIANKIIGTGEGWLTELSNGELKQVLALGREAVGD